MLVIYLIINKITFTLLLLKKKIIHTKIKIKIIINK